MTDSEHRGSDPRSRGPFRPPRSLLILVVVLVVASTGVASLYWVRFSSVRSETRGAPTTPATPTLAIAVTTTAAEKPATSTATAATKSTAGTTTAAAESTTGAATSTWEPRFPIHAAFYYPWFPEAWTQQGYQLFTQYHPSLGWYDSSRKAVIRAHIRGMLYAHIHVGIASWWGKGSETDGRVSKLLTVASGYKFRWALYYEPEGYGDPSPTKIAHDLAYIRRSYAASPSYLTLHGKPVIFVWADAGDGCGMARRWAKASRTFYVVLKDFPGYTGCANQPDDWHQYAPAEATQVSVTSFSVSPGFYKKGEASPRLARHPRRFARDVRAMVASGKRWQLVTTWNEWGEGTAVESAKEWASPSGYGTYADILHRLFRGGG